MLKSLLSVLKLNLSEFAFKETINSLWLNPQGEIRHLNTCECRIYRLSAESLPTVLNTNMSCVESHGTATPHLYQQIAFAFCPPYPHQRFSAIIPVLG